VRPIRQFLFPLWDLGVRLATLPGRVALVVSGIAAAAVLLAGVLAGGLVAHDRALARAPDRLPSAERGLRAAWFGIPRQGAEFATLDRTVARAFLAADARDPVRALQFRQTRLGGKLVDLGAVDGLERWIRLRSRTSTPSTESAPFA
jgi:hypothetical protein